MNKTRKGFTIIEVVLVLAIGGLIFLMVFVALPALQRSQRNSQRKDDVARFFTAFQEYQTNNSRKLPFRNGSVDTRFVARYIDKEVVWDSTKARGSEVTACGDQFRDPDGECYQFLYVGNTYPDFNYYNNVQGYSDALHLLYVYTKAHCNSAHGEGYVEYFEGVNSMALLYKQEGGAFICVDNT